MIKKNSTYKHLYVNYSTDSYYQVLEFLSGNLSAIDLLNNKHLDLSMIVYWLKIIKTECIY